MTTDRRIMHPNISGVYGIESIDGYDPLYLFDYAQFVSVMQSDNPDAKLGSFNRIITPQKISSNLINLLNVQYVLSFDQLNLQNLDLVHVEGETKVYQNKDALPRAFFVEEVVKVQTKKDQYRILLEPDFDPSKKASSQEYSFSPKSINSKVEIASYAGQKINLEVTTDEKKPLVFANVYYPGWEAYIDGAKTKIFVSDAIFQLIEVPAGSHSVEFKFAPKSFYNGLVASGLSALTAFAITIFIWRRKYR